MATPSIPPWQPKPLGGFTRLVTIDGETYRTETQFLRDYERTPEGERAHFVTEARWYLQLAADARKDGSPWYHDWVRTAAWMRRRAAAIEVTQ